jgi:hypothetical protein
VKAARKKLAQPADLNTPEGVEWFRQVADEWDRRARKNPEAAFAELVAAGIYTKTGKLTKNYR